MPQNSKITRLPSHIGHPPVTPPNRRAQYRNRTDQETGWVGYGKLRKVMEGYGNFPAFADPCRASLSAIAKAEAFAAAEASAAAEAPVKPSQTQSNHFFISHSLFSPYTRRMKSSRRILEFL